MALPRANRFALNHNSSFPPSSNNCVGREFRFDEPQESEANAEEFALNGDGADDGDPKPGA